MSQMEQDVKMRSCAKPMHNIQYVSPHPAALPPPVDPYVGGTRKPRVQEVNAAHRAGSSDRLPQRRVVVQAEAFPKPMDGIWGHFILKRREEQAKIR